MDVFAFFLAEKLGKTVGEIEQMSHIEYVQWSAYYVAKNAISNQKGVM